MRQEIAKVMALRDVAEGIFELELHAPGICGDMVLPGQFVQVSLNDESRILARPISVRDVLGDDLILTIQKKGEGTRQLSRLNVGDDVKLTGCMGNGFDWDDDEGDYILVGGGIGMAPIRTIMLHVMEHASEYGRLSLLYGARSPEDMAYKADLPGWLESDVLHTTLTIDREAPNWPHRVGMIPNVLKELAPSPDNTIAVLCGPPIMIKFTLAAFREMGFKDENIITTLERRMKCGIGICGRCNLGGKYVCLDGPVFSQAELNNLPPEM